MDNQRNRSRTALTPLVALAALACGTAAAAPWPAGYAVVPGSVSPDGRLGVIAPDVAHATLALGSRQDRLVELATGRTLATIDGPTAARGQNELDVHAAWPAGGSLLVWYVDGKWGSFDLVTVCVDRGRVAAQTDVRELAVREVLAAVARARPAVAAAAAREGTREGWWFRAGLAIDVRPAAGGARVWPRRYAIAFTSNPKQLSSYPAAAQLAGTLEATQARCGGPLRFGELAFAR